MKTMSY